MEFNLKWRLELWSIVYSEKMLKKIFDSKEMEWTIWYEITSRVYPLDYTKQYSIEWKKTEWNMATCEIFYHIKTREYELLIDNEEITEQIGEKILEERKWYEQFELRKSGNELTLIVD